MQLKPLAILMCTFQGQKFLAEQFDSFTAQTRQDWTLWISDDGSWDTTRSIIETYRQRWPTGRLNLLDGPQRGFAANFLSMVCHAQVEANYFAWSDQDDCWEPDKLDRAMAWLTQQSVEIPALYCSRTRLVDAQNQHIGYSPLFRKPPCFRNALTQNVGGGNTMVFNHAARDLIREAGDTTPAVSHDWWAYQLVSACGGNLFYDPYPSVRYRQHSTNLVGANIGLRAHFKRISLLLSGRFRAWNTANLDALEEMKHRITPENQQVISHFHAARGRGLFPRLLGLVRSKAYRQTILGTLALFLGTLIRKI